MFDRYADVAVRLPISGTFTYRVPAEMYDAVRPGLRVQVSFRNRDEEAVICAVHGNAPDFEVLPLTKLIDSEPILTEYQLQLGFWMADYYLAGPGECLGKMFPAGRRYPKRLEKRASAPGAPNHVLNREQDAAYRSIVAAQPGQGAHLIHGVTGSGKTEVYIHLILDALKRGRGALLLVPEITLTVQLIERLRSVFGDELALLHSALGGSERFGSYVHVLRGDQTIAVGTRSAVFAPVRDPGVIILDEEHDGSYKEHSAPRYDARQIAHKRAADHGAHLVLGSATPRIETAYHARAMSESTHFHYYALSGRATGAELPDVRLTKITSGDAPVSGDTLNELEKNLKDGRQTILLLNRRGYHPFVYCATCERTESCPNCSVALNLHRDQRLLCHYCAYEREYRGQCSNCGGPARPVGSGTQKLEEFLLNLYPDARLERLDTDAATKRHAVRDCIRRLIDGEIDILLGTQMIAKGLDAPNVTLVSVLQADHGFAMPDFRAAERTFSLLTQVAGRAGRGEHRGRVIFECLNPANPVLHHAARQDYEAFYREEVVMRKAAAYPPFTRIVRLLYRGEDEGAVRTAADRLAGRLRRAPDLLGEDHTSLLGPAPAPLEKLHNQYRYHMILKTGRMRRLREILSDVLAAERGSGSGKLHLEVDFDPVDLL